MTQPEPFRILDVAAWERNDYEQMGSKEKAWLESPDGEVWLYKLLRSDATGNRYGDDQAEIIGANVAHLLGIPTARVELARGAGTVGIATLRMHDTKSVDLVHGNEMLAGVDNSYDKAKRHENIDYTVPGVEMCLLDVLPPPGWSGPAQFSGFAVWTGYLLLDAWIANQDRHHENWGSLVSRMDGGKILAPSFDHGSSLGFNIFPAQAAEMGRQAGRVESWASKGRSGSFAGRPSLVRLANEAFAIAGGDVGRYWLERLDKLEPASWRSIVDRVPASRMSEPSRKFVLTLLDANRRRLLDGAC